VNADRACALVGLELGHAQEKWPPMQSAHEGYSVILEELDELWHEIKLNSGMRTDAMRAEAIQVAAMALRFVIDCT
jgi:hypothetical protein